MFCLVPFPLLSAPSSRPLPLLRWGSTPTGTPGEIRALALASAGASGGTVAIVDDAAAAASSTLTGGADDGIDSGGRAAGADDGDDGDAASGAAVVLSGVEVGGRESAWRIRTGGRLHHCEERSCCRASRSGSLKPVMTSHSSQLAIVSDDVSYEGKEMPSSAGVEGARGARDPVPRPTPPDETTPHDRLSFSSARASWGSRLTRSAGASTSSTRRRVVVVVVVRPCDCFFLSRLQLPASANDSPRLRTTPRVCERLLASATPRVCSAA